MKTRSDRTMRGRDRRETELFQSTRVESDCGVDKVCMSVCGWGEIYIYIFFDVVREFFSNIETGTGLRCSREVSESECD